jgi:hypothetical protein
MTKKQTSKQTPTFEGSIEPIKKTKVFWCVAADGKNAPTKQHETEFDALQEAIRIANKERCDTFVLKCTKVVSLIPFIETVKS